MALSTLRPFGFSKRVPTKLEKTIDTPIPFDDCDHPSTTYHNARSYRRNGTFGSYMSPLSPTQPHTAAQKSGTRLQHARHAQNSSIVSSSTNKLPNLQLRILSDIPTIREGFSEKQLQEQIKEVYSALRRVEDEREKILSRMKAGRADQCRVERELEETRRENRRLTARLEEMLRTSKMKSPLSPRNDDGWGCNVEAEGY